MPQTCRYLFELAYSMFIMDKKDAVQHIMTMNTHLPLSLPLPHSLLQEKSRIHSNEWLFIKNTEILLCAYLPFNKYFKINYFILRILVLSSPKCAKQVL